MISQVRIGLGLHAHARGISALSAAAIEHGLRQRWTPARVLESLRDPATNVAVATDGRRLVGFGIMDYGETRAHLALLAVREEARRQGVGSALLAWLEKCASTAGIDVVRAEVRLENFGARQFYRILGYREGARLAGYYQGLEDAVSLEKRLGA